VSAGAVKRATRSLALIGALGAALLIFSGDAPAKKAEPVPREQPAQQREQADQQADQPDAAADAEQADEPRASNRDTVIVGSKKFTESVVLGYLATQMLRSDDIPSRHRAELGGTRILWSAMDRGAVDVYPEYTGTLSYEIFAGQGLRTVEEIRRHLNERGIRMSPPIGFANNYGVAMRSDHAERLGVETISDLEQHEDDLVFGLNNEFLDRSDGWPGLRRAYDLDPQTVRGLDHDIAYRAMEEGDIDVMDVYTTDAEIAELNLKVLEDDQEYFPQYEAHFLYRADAAERHPALADALARFENRIDESAMTAMNKRAKVDRAPARRVAAEFLEQTMGVDVEIREVSAWGAFWRRTQEHFFLVGISMAAAILIATPLGIAAAKLPGIGQAILGAVGILQTIPVLALLVFMVPVFGIGAEPTIAMLFIYSLLPIVRNTHSGLVDIPAPVRESAEALGLRAGERLRLVELPLAARTILTGVKTSVVINIGAATLGALIGAGGYGEPILTGIRLDDMGLIFQGAGPAAGMAILAQLAFEGAERAVVPRGLRLKGG